MQNPPAPGGKVLLHFELISMATRFDLGQGIELIRIPAIYGNETNPRWYITRGNDYILHRRMGWVRYDSVSDGEFLFPDVDSAFSFFSKAGVDISEQRCQEAEAQQRDEVAPEA
jgi:hypothetical protein